MLDVDVNDGVYVNNERQQFEHNSGISFSCHSHRVLGTSFEPSTARSRTTAKKVNEMFMVRIKTHMSRSR